MTGHTPDYAPLTEDWVDLLDHGLEADGCHGFYVDHINTNRAVMQIVAEAKADALLHYADACAAHPGQGISWSRDVAHDIREWVQMGLHLEPRSRDEG